uniref:Solute carrier family 5 member 8 n=1 Tax=Oncorhynchus mykiss TaxID=8022 RepID=A0A8C7SYY8_ONCMY
FAFPRVIGSFVAADYAVFALMLLVSAAIGVYYAIVGRGQSSSREFLMGGQSMTAVPVALSLTASFMSAITVLATPAEVYRYGASYGLFSLSYVLVVVVSSEVFLPVFYRLGITSTYEYLEIRFNRATRLLGTVMFIVQTMLYTGIVIYAPALALNQVTGMDLWGAVISTGVVCTFYCAMGGLKAVVWTDVFQVGIMVAGFLSVIIRAVVLQGGVSNILNHAELGGRLNFWDFDASPLRRYTFWTITFGGTFVWTSIYGINQAQVQRYISCKSMTHAKMSLYINLLGLWIIMLCSVFAGLCLYSVYKHCDPWTAGTVSAADQLMPYMVMDILRDYPGLPGLFVAAAYSGTLSTVSSSVNALAAVTIEDLIKPYTHMTEKHLYAIQQKEYVVLHKICCLEVRNSKICLCLLLRPLGLTTHGCNFTIAADAFNWTASPTEPSLYTTVLQQNTAERPFLADNWYSLSYLYFSPIGTLTTLAVGLVVSLLSGGMKLNLEPTVTLMKEDTMLFCFYKLFKERVSDLSVSINNLQDVLSLSTTFLYSFSCHPYLGHETSRKAGPHKKQREPIGKQ